MICISVAVPWSSLGVSWCGVGCGVCWHAVGCLAWHCCGVVLEASAVVGAFFGVLVMVVVVVCENWKVDASIFLFCAVFFVCVFFGHTVDALAW